MIRKVIPYFLFALSIFLAQCSGTRCLQEGETLYTGNTLIIKHKQNESTKQIKYTSLKYSAAYLNVWDLPNGALFGLPALRFIPFRLIAYNWFYTKKEKGLKAWLRDNLGEEPTLISDIQPDIKLKQLIQTFENFGHFGTDGSFTIKYKRKKKKGFVKYILEVPDAYTYRKVDWMLDSAQKHMLSSFLAVKRNSIIQPNLEYNLDSLKNEKNELYNALQNDGFCYVEKEDIEIEADSTVGNKQIDIRIRMNSDLSDARSKKSIVNSIAINIDSTLKTVNSEGFYTYVFGKLKRKFIDSINFLRPGKYYSLKHSYQTINRMNSLGIFKAAYISYRPLSDSNTLQSTLYLLPAKASNLSFNIKGSYKTAGYIGPSIGVKLSQLNLFGKAQNLYVEIDYYYDFPIGVFRDRISNSSGLSARSIVKAPYHNSKLKLAKNSAELPFQFITYNIEYNDRKQFFKMISWNTSYGINWSHKKNRYNRLDLINITYSSLLTTTQRFDQLVAENPSLRTSLVDQFILGLDYTYTFDNRSKELNPKGMYLQFHTETAGNLLSLTNSIFKNDSKGNKQFFKITFAQFVLLHYDFRYYLKTGRSSSIVLRHIGAYGVPYGNSQQLPYIKQFFIGGTNSLRPVGARTVGPGRYLEFNQGEVNQVGDIKLELNLEFRFRIAVRLNGAFWSDAGNIWLFKEDPDRPGSGIRWGKIAEDSYLTAGTGLRVDLNLLILRIDYGYLLYAPIFSEGYRWIWQNKLPLWHGLIGFGYPF